MTFNYPAFLNTTHLAGKIDSYFDYIEGEYHLEQKLLKDETVADIKVYYREPEPPTFSGYIYFLGFNSRMEFEQYDQNGEYAYLIARGQLRIEAIYEKKLHQQSPAGAIFALKSMGWNEKPEIKTATAVSPPSLTIEILNTGPKPVGAEKDVIL